MSKSNGIIHAVVIFFSLALNANFLLILISGFAGKLTTSNPSTKALRYLCVHVWTGNLLEQSKSVPIHVRNLQFFMTEIYETKYGLKPPFMKEIFILRNISYSLRRGGDAQLPKVRTTSFGVESIDYLCKKLWQFLPQEIKQSNSLSVFKKQIRCWNGGKGNCRLCKVHIQEVGFLTGQVFLALLYCNI